MLEYSLRNLKNQNLIDFLLPTKITLGRDLGTNFIDGKFFIGAYPSKPLHAYDDAHIERAVIHELSHFIEIEDRKLFKKNYGLLFSDEGGDDLFRYSMSYEMSGRNSIKVNTLKIEKEKGFDREFRVFGIQKILYNYLKIELPADFIFFGMDFKFNVNTNIEPFLLEALYKDLNKKVDESIMENIYTERYILEEWQRKNSIVSSYIDEYQDAEVLKYMGSNI